MIEVTIPGKPVPSRRPRFSRVGNRVHTHMPEDSQSYKAVVQHHLLVAMKSRGLLPSCGAVSVEIDAYFECPKSQRRKREKTPQRPHTGRPDCDNLAKQLLDAGNGVAWVDDAQVFRCVVQKFVAAQDEPPRVVVRIDR